MFKCWTERSCPPHITNYIINFEGKISHFQPMAGQNKNRWLKRDKDRKRNGGIERKQTDKERKRWIE